MQTIQGPPFYQQVAGTVVLCDVTISLTNSYSDITDLDLNCRTLRDNTLPAATAEQLGELQQNMQFISKVGKTSLGSFISVYVQHLNNRIRDDQVGPGPHV